MKNHHILIILSLFLFESINAQTGPDLIIDKITITSCSPTSISYCADIKNIGNHTSYLTNFVGQCSGYVSIQAYLRVNSNGSPHINDKPAGGTVVSCNPGTYVTGDNNVFLGISSGHFSSGNENIFIGKKSGHSIQGSNNIFIGKYAGPERAEIALQPASRLNKNLELTIDGEDEEQPLLHGESHKNIPRISTVLETVGAVAFNPEVNNRLYIDQECTDTPLIYGEFDNNLVRFNGEFEATGGVAQNSDVNTKEAISEINYNHILEKIE